MPLAVLNGISIAFDDAGSGDDVLLLVHGHPFNRSMWAPQLAALAGTGRRVIAPDLRGYGESTVVPGTTTLEVFAADLAALLDHLGIERVVIGGLSMGGQIAMEFCRRYPHRVRGLLLAATFPQPETGAGKEARRTMAERLLKEGMGPYAGEVIDKMLAPRSIEVLPDVAAHVDAMMRGTNPEGAAAALRGRAERPDYAPVLASLDVPALVVVGSDDAYTTRDDAERMRGLLRGSELLWLPGIGHMPNLEAADAFNAAVEALLNRVAAGDSHVAEDQYRIAFEAMPWTESPQGARSKARQIGGRRLRLVEFGRDLEHPDWCTAGHIGLVLEGEMEVEFEDRCIRFRAGDGVNLPSGEAHRHRPKALTERVRLVFVEDC